MVNDEKEIRELRRLLRDLVALATAPALWVGRDRAQIAESTANILLHTLRADAVFVCLQPPKRIEVVRSPQHPGFGDEVKRLWSQFATASPHIQTITAPMWPSALRVAMQPIGTSGDDGFIVAGCAGSGFPNEGEAQRPELFGCGRRLLRNRTFIDGQVPSRLHGGWPETLKRGSRTLLSVM
jgi:hypothetical protein